MCNSRNSTRPTNLQFKSSLKVDKCLARLICFLNVPTIACCCGHNKYPMSIIVKTVVGSYFDLISRKTIKRKRNFYRKDEHGFYYLPESIGEP